jgi:MoxR-like ATPase
LDSKILPKNILKCPENEFENFFETESFHQVDKYAKIAIENGRHILFTGKEGVGITSIAKIIADKYSNDKNKDFIFVFTEETTIGDLIGRFIPDSFENNDNVIKWEDGPLTEAIKNGYSGIFLNVDSVDSKILERINCLLDQKESEDDNYFKISENPNLDKIKINEKFRFFCTCSLDKLDSLSDAFLNRLTVINIDNQFENLNIYEDLPNLIKILIKQENLNIEVDKELINCLKRRLRNVLPQYRRSKRNS